jgi:hypothetical protein
LLLAATAMQRLEQLKRRNGVSSTKKGKKKVVIASKNESAPLLMSKPAAPADPAADPDGRVG